jgi:hypothetical protein
VLILVPASFVIVLLLGAIAVDAAMVHLGQRRAYDVAAHAANDAAGAGIDRDVARRSGAFVYDPRRVHEIAAGTVRAADIDGLRFLYARPGRDGGVAVAVEIRVRRLLGQAFGAPHSHTLRVTARASAETRGP